jgi:hypothetical protein
MSGNGKTVPCGEDVCRDRTACETMFNVSALTEVKIDPFLENINMPVKTNHILTFFSVNISVIMTLLLVLKKTVQMTHF